jgi:flagellar P-ring protein precursor FlgI
VPTAGRIAGGASIEREVGFQLARMDQMRLHPAQSRLHRPPGRVADAINARFPGSAIAENPTIVSSAPPGGLSMVSFVSQLENLSSSPTRRPRW